MNAVERLLSHGERVVVFFDEVLAPQGGLDPRTVESVHRNLATYTDGGPFAPPAFELKTAPARYRKALTADRLDLLFRWQSEPALETAIARAVEEGARSKKRHGYGVDLSPRALAIYCDMLAERERLLDPKPMQAMLADVVAESLSWGPHAATVASLSKSLADALGRLLSRPCSVARKSDGQPFMLAGGAVIHNRDWLSEKARHLQPAIELLRIYAQPPKPAGSTLENQTATTKTKKRSRKGIGGVKRKYPDDFVRDVQAARKREEKACRKSKERLPLKVEWLRLYCRNRGIDTAKMFPSKDEAAPEPWDVRANRFWHAVTARESRDEN